MGRRSINTTKSGKYMNPTDQARKEARKKELKKNKKQRQMVRQAVLKGKDPVQIIGEMEKIDSMEYNVLQPAPLNEKVLKDKRRKLRETLDRVLKLYQKEDPEKYDEVKRVEVEYEKRRLSLVTFSEAVRHAQQVQVDDIPLPLAGGIPLPDVAPPAGILRKRSAYSPPPLPGGQARSILSSHITNKRPPGVPPGPPPVISSDEEDNTYMEDKSRRTIRFADKDSDDSDDESRDIPSLSGLPPQPPNISGPPRVDDMPPGLIPPPPALPAPTGQLPIGLPPARPLGVLGMRPPGPPPGLPPRLLPPIRLPPGPPPGLPRVLPPRLTPNVLTAAPQLIRKDTPSGQAISLSKGPTIEAKAQIRNLSADITRFVPTALRVKRADDKLRPIGQAGRTAMVEQMNEPPQPTKPQQQTKDDAYSQFMREMEGLL